MYLIIVWICTFLVFHSTGQPHQCNLEEDPCNENSCACVITDHDAYDITFPAVNDDDDDNDEDGKLWVEENDSSEELSENCVLCCEEVMSFRRKSRQCTSICGSNTCSDTVNITLKDNQKVTYHQSVNTTGNLHISLKAITQSISSQYVCTLHYVAKVPTQITEDSQLLLKNISTTPFVCNDYQGCTKISSVLCQPYTSQCYNGSHIWKEKELAINGDNLHLYFDINNEHQTHESQEIQLLNMNFQVSVQGHFWIQCQANDYFAQFLQEMEQYLRQNETETSENREMSNSQETGFNSEDGEIMDNSNEDTDKHDVNTNVNVNNRGEANITMKINNTNTSANDDGSMNTQLSNINPDRSNTIHEDGNTDGINKPDLSSGIQPNEFIPDLPKMREFPNENSANMNVDSEPGDVRAFEVHTNKNSGAQVHGNSAVRTRSLVLGSVLGILFMGVLVAAVFMTKKYRCKKKLRSNIGVTNGLSTIEGVYCSFSDSEVYNGDPIYNELDTARPATQGTMSSDMSNPTYDASMANGSQRDYDNVRILQIYNNATGDPTYDTPAEA